MSQQPKTQAILMAEALGARIDWEADAKLEGPIPDSAKQWFWQRHSMGKAGVGTLVHMPEGAMREESESVFPSAEAAARDFLWVLSAACARAAGPGESDEVRAEARQAASESDWNNALDGLDRVDILECGYLAGAARDPLYYAIKVPE